MPMDRWFTADLHLGHANIIRYCHRPFDDVSAMDEAVVRGWNEVVDVDDEVWVLGDFAMGTLDRSLPLGRRLHGTKRLLVGNHDRPFLGKLEDRYLDEAGFVEVRHGTAELDLDADHRVLACHFPYRGDSGDTDRFEDRRPEDRGGWLLHGHVHDTWRQDGRQLNVGIDAWAGRPVGAAALVTLIDAGPRRLGPLPWGRRATEPAT